MTYSMSSMAISYAWSIHRPSAIYIRMQKKHRCHIDTNRSPDMVRYVPCIKQFDTKYDPMVMALGGKGSPAVLADALLTVLASSRMCVRLCLCVHAPSGCGQTIPCPACRMLPAQHFHIHITDNTSLSLFFAFSLSFSFFLDI